MERGWRPNVELSPNCPRCGSFNTKFCYYNNYSLTQPRYFCKGCRRYWTKGGSLRNVPVGGGCRKNRRGSRSSRLLVSASEGVNCSSKGLSYEDLANGYPIRVSHGNCSIGNSLVEESRSSVLSSNGSHIDLALVFSNFLNQKPNSNNPLDHLTESELPNNVHDPSLVFSLPEENGVIGFDDTCHHLSMENCLNLDEQIYGCGLNSDENKHQGGIEHFDIGTGLPSLPGQEVAYEDQVMWSNSMEATNLQVLGMEGQEQNMLITGNWSPFDLPSD